MANIWTTYLNGKAIATHQSEWDACKFEKNKVWELAMNKQLSDSTIETLCSADEERFIIVETPEYDFGKYSVNIKGQPHLCVGICQTKEEAEAHKAWCEVHHWTVDYYGIDK